MSLLLLRKLLLSVILVLSLQLALQQWLLPIVPQYPYLPLLVNLSSILVICLVFAVLGRDIQQVVETLELGVKCFEDNDFSITIQNKRKDELGRIIDAYNDVSQAIRKERLNLYQRELLLDTIMQETPVAMILTDGTQRVVYSNDAAIKLFECHNKLEGELFSQLIKGLPDVLQKASTTQKAGLYSYQTQHNKNTYYLNYQCFTINNREHHLYLYKNMTTEISRQEIDLWKNAIRLMSHELNNSLAPITSLTHSAKDILNKPQHMDMLPEILDTISQRTVRLHAFIEQYAQFARLPLPTKRAVKLTDFIATILRLCDCRLQGEIPNIEVKMDRGQMEQVLINLLKNAKETGCDVADISLSVNALLPQRLLFCVTDSGPGMSEPQLQQALLPFFSTKQQGTGLGLSLCHEIIQAHDGEMRLANRQEGGLEVCFWLPMPYLAQ